MKLAAKKTKTHTFLPEKSQKSTTGGQPLEPKVDVRVRIPKPGNKAGEEDKGGNFCPQVPKVYNRGRAP